MNILVTGGSGFIGTNLVEALICAGHNVKIYDNVKSKLFPDSCIVGDIQNRDRLTESASGIDAVYHLAAVHRDYVRPISQYYDVNVGGTNNIVYALEKNNINKVIFTSTVALYGRNALEPNEDSPIRPFNDYGQSKYESECLLNSWADSDPKRCLVTVRPSVVFGENNRGNVYRLLAQIASGKFIMIGSGKNKKSMAYVRNLSQFLIYCLESIPGQHVYNYADKPDLKVNELVRITYNCLNKGNGPAIRVPYLVGVLGGYAGNIIAKITGRNYPIRSIRVRKLCSESRISTEKLEKTGFKAPHSLTDALNRVIINEFIDNSKDPS